MTEPRKPEQAAGEQAGEQETAPKTEKTGKTLQELERLQFDALERVER